MLTRFLLLLLFHLVWMFTPKNSLGNNSDIDSLKAELQAHPEADTVRAEILIDLGNFYRHQSIDTARLYGKEALEIAEAKSFLSGIASASSLLGKTHYYQGEYEKALPYYSRALEIALQKGIPMRVAASYLDLGAANVKLGDRKTGIEMYQKGLPFAKESGHKGIYGEYYNRLATLYKFQGDMEKATENYQKALTLKLENEEWRGVVYVNYNLGMLYDMQGDFLTALDFQQKALKIAEEKEVPLSAKAGVLLELGKVYLTLGEYTTAIEKFNKAFELYDKTGKVNSVIHTYFSLAEAYQRIDSLAVARNYYEKALAAARTNKAATETGTSLFGLAELSIQEGKAEDAIILLKEAKAIREEIEDLDLLAETEIKLGRAYLMQGNLANAETHANKGIELAEKSQSLIDRNSGYQLLYELNQKKNNYKKALKAFVAYKATSDSLLNESNIREITKLEKQYEFDREKEQIALEQAKKEAFAEAEISQEKLIRNVSLVGLTLVGILAFVLYRNFDQKRKANLLLTEQKKQIEAKNAENELLLKEIHHRVKNNLQIVSSLLNLQTKNTEDEKALAAVSEGQNRLKAMALIHQGLYQNEDIATIDFSQYAQSLAEQLSGLYRDERQTQLKVEGTAQKFDIDTAVPLGLILNELITNSFKYAFESIDTKQLTIRLSEIEKGKHRLEVVDNGKGLPEGFEWSKATSTGLRLVRRLARQLQGEFRYAYENGAHFIIDFKDTELRKQVL